jgi:phosphotransferase system enzyme I (PtsI)
MLTEIQELHLQGTSICKGIAIGYPFLFSFVEDVTPEYSIAEEAIPYEVERYRHAISQSKLDILQLQKQLEQEHILEGAAILDTHLQIMEDPLITSHVEEKMRLEKKNAESTFEKLINQYQQRFDILNDPYFRERFKDVRDISKRVMGYLRKNIRITFADIPKNSIVFTQDLTPSEAAEARNGQACAFVTAMGGTTSHAAIVAKAKGIPYVTNVPCSCLEQFQNCLIIVDGRTGEIIINPTPETLAKYVALQRSLQIQLKQMEKVGMLETKTADGRKVHLSANIELVYELDLLHKYGGNGVGLFRTEYIFPSLGAFPAEEEQFAIYSQMVKKMKGLPIVIRTFDIGGDKHLAQEQMAPHEKNPFLGCRAIRFLLKERDIFKSQLRAILRASAFGNVHILFPMVSGLSELREAKKLVSEARKELQQVGVEVPASNPIGCMIEVPSAAIISDLLARECDFLSIGTNDLVQYSLAVDRSNQAMSDLYAPTHPSIIRLIQWVVKQASRCKIPVTLCGEIASDPRFTALLLGLGIHELSVAIRYIPLIKNTVRNTTLKEAKELAERVLKLEDAFEIQELLASEYRKSVPEDCLYNY